MLLAFTLSTGTNFNDLQCPWTAVRHNFTVYRFFSLKWMQTDPYCWVKKIAGECRFQRCTYHCINAQGSPLEGAYMCKISYFWTLHSNVDINGRRRMYFLRETCLILNIIMKKPKQFKKVCKDDSHELAELKQQKSKRLILLLQHIAITSMCS